MKQVEKLSSSNVNAIRLVIDKHAVSPFLEMGAYESLWAHKDATFKSLAKKFAAKPGSIPSNFVPHPEAYQKAKFVQQQFKNAGIGRFGVCVYGAGEYPEKLRDATHPVNLFYYQGWLDLAHSRSIAVIGTRKPSKEGLLRTRSVVRKLVSDEFTVVSGLAAGIDQEAHKTAIEEKGQTIAVIGTPLSYTYPKENKDLQRKIRSQYLLISQVPLLRYESQDYRVNRFFFLERNVTMSALTEATIIIEAGRTSGTLAQARDALRQGRKLFILNNCFENDRLNWPNHFAKKGAIRVRSYDDIRTHLE